MYYIEPWPKLLRFKFWSNYTMIVNFRLASLIFVITHFCRKCQQAGPISDCIVLDSDRAYRYPSQCKLCDKSRATRAYKQCTDGIWMPLNCEGPSGTKCAQTKECNVLCYQQGANCFEKEEPTVSYQLPSLRKVESG